MFSDLLLQLIIFFLPTQLGLHFWPSFSRAAGIKVDYLSPTLYFTDILILLYLALNLTPLFKYLKKRHRSFLIFTAFLVVNLFFSLSFFNSFFWALRFFLYLLFFLTLKINRITWLKIKKTLLLSTITIVSLEFLQFFYQSSIGGPFYLLGERAFTFSTPGMARASFFNQEFIRPSSTFSHPNSLAGYLLIVFYLFHLHKSPFWQKSFILAGLILTFSKAALLAFILVIVLNINPLFLISSSLIFSLLQLLTPIFPISYQFISDRLFFLTPTRDIILTHLPFGVGLGNFVPALSQVLPGSFLLPSKLQPVHNLFLLVLSETGFLGLLGFCLFVKQNFLKIKKPLFLGLLALVFIAGSFDHYWWTLPQNKLLVLFASSLLL